MSVEFRFSFSPGSGVCLWPRNAAAEAHFSFPTDHDTLPLSLNTKCWLTYLIAWFDTSINWESPGESDGCWSEADRRCFREAAARGLALLRQELPDYQFFDETRV